MVLFFVLLTIVTYLLVMKYVLKNIQRPVEAAGQHISIQEKNHKQFVPVHTTR